MADIRINALATTAASTASDDFIAIDGSANGTRKLNAYSPTFGGNLTVSGSITGNTILADTVSATTNDQIETASFKANTSGTADVGFGPKQRFYAENNTGSLGVIGEIAYKLESASTYSSSLVLRNRSGGDINDVLTIAANKNATLAGNLTVSGRDLTLGSSESVIYFGTPSANYLYYNGSSLFLRVASVDRITIPASTGNVLIGTTTDGGQKLQVSGTAYVSGDATFAGILTINGSGTTQIVSNVSIGTGSGKELTVASGGGNGGITFSQDWRARRENAVTGNFIIEESTVAKLTLAATSGNATFAGTISPQQAATASAPTYVKGAIYFDTTLNKLRVGGASGWETITSV